MNDERPAPLDVPPAPDLASIEEPLAMVRSDCQWVIRCARRVSEISTRISFSDALDVAEALSLDDGLRCRVPERVAEDIAGDRHYFS